MMSLIPYKDAVCKDLVMSPVDPSTSKRRWESHLFELRQCVDLLKNELPGTCGECIDMCPDSPAEIWKDDFRGGASSADIICSCADEDTGRQQLAFTHEQWYCLSAKRRTALVRQEARQEAKDSDDYLCFLRMWHKSFSLYCCPSYSENATAKIRLPCFSLANEQLPELGSLSRYATLLTLISRIAVLRYLCNCWIAWSLSIRRGRRYGRLCRCVPRSVLKLYKRN